jgi:hypothetical protein
MVKIFTITLGANPRHSLPQFKNYFVLFNIYGDYNYREKLIEMLLQIYYIKYPFCTINNKKEKKKKEFELTTIVNIA